MTIIDTALGINVVIIGVGFGTPIVANARGGAIATAALVPTESKTAIDKLNATATEIRQPIGAPAIAPAAITKEHAVSVTNAGQEGVVTKSNRLSLKLKECNGKRVRDRLRTIAHQPVQGAAT